ncbi:hypothetical protein K3495_g14893 [Podosphaera aphanis]|nr:hypothetical protein K3495_g14893 [Podosphaera aphanis]
MTCIVSQLLPPPKAVIVSYPLEAPQEVVEKAKSDIQKAGGIITNQYDIIRGFAAIASSQMLENIKANNKIWEAAIEDVQNVSILPQETDSGHGTSD